MDDARAPGGARRLNEVVVTLDVDWAPQFVVEDVAQLLADRGVAATWFVTHDSPALEALRSERDLFELGIHPNFLPGSTQGTSPDEVLDGLLALVPEAVSVRSHRLVQSAELFATMARRPQLEIESSTFLPRMPGVRPVVQRSEGGQLLQVPFVWSDDYEMLEDEPCWEPEPLLALDGLAVLAFHPIHVYLNLASLRDYAALKRRLPAVAEAGRRELEELTRPGEGARTLFRRLLDALAPLETRPLADLR